MLPSSLSFSRLNPTLRTFSDSDISFSLTHFSTESHNVLLLKHRRHAFTHKRLEKKIKKGHFGHQRKNGQVLEHPKIPPPTHSPTFCKSPVAIKHFELIASSLKSFVLFETLPLLAYCYCVNNIDSNPHYRCFQ